MNNSNKSVVFSFTKDKCVFKDECTKECPYETGELRTCNKGLFTYCAIECNTAELPIGWRNMVNTEINYDTEDKEEYEYLESILDDIYNWAKEGNNLYIYSENVGNGKTTWAVKLAYEAIIYLHSDNRLLTNSIANGDFEKICNVFYLNVQEFLAEAKQSIGNKTKSNRIRNIQDKIKYVDLVIWDDIGNKVLSDYDFDILYTLLNYRIGANKSNIFTSNVIDQELVNNMGRKLASRILETSNIVEFFSPSFRRPKRPRRR